MNDCHFSVNQSRSDDEPSHTSGKCPVFGGRD